MLQFLCLFNESLISLSKNKLNTAKRNILSLISNLFDIFWCFYFELKIY